MTRQDYRKAIDSFEPDVYMKRRIAARIGQEGRHGRSGRPARRALAGVLAAVLALVCIMGITMAASPEFRQTVLSFFHLEEAERVPEPGNIGEISSEEPAVLEADIGGQVKVQYIQAGDSDYNSTVELEEDGTVRAFIFWDLKDGVLTKQELEPQKSSFAVTWRGETYQGDVFWRVQNDELSLYADGYTIMSETEWDVRSVSGRTDAVILHVSQGSQIDYAGYEFLYHLDTGEVEDALAGTGAERLEYAYDYTWADNLSKLLVTCRGNGEINGAETYYCDVAAKTLTEIGTLTGTEANYASFADSETLIVSSFTDTECSCWAYDLVTGRTVQVLDQAHRYLRYDEEAYGIMFSGSRYGIYVARSGKTSVFDFKTGEQTPVENFTFSRDGSFLSNPSNTKILYWVADDAVSGLGISELGVLDLEGGAFLSFGRVGYHTLYEWGLSWFDDDRVAINASTPGEGGSQYLYLYEF